MLLPTVLFVVCSVVTSQAQSNDLTKGISSFASEFYSQCANSQPGDNIIISPLSVSSVLALISQGANANTYEELKKGLHLSGNKTSTADQFHEYYAGLQRSIGQSVLSIANKIYVKNDYKVKKEFHDVAVEKFSSDIANLDFGKSAESANEINQFVQEKTHDRIKDLIEPSMINSDTRMVLVNAIYFKGNWKYQFDQKRTMKNDFYTSETDKVSVDMMRMKKYFNYAILDDLDATALEMQYANSNFTFLILLPNNRTGLAALETKLKNYDLSQITAQMRSEEVDVSIPKFKVEFKINLNEVLKNMGMGEMFSDKSDLSGLLDSSEPLAVSDVVHKAFIEVNEEGAEAAAATGAIVMLRASLRQHYEIFKADHPFVYFIRETESNTNLFSGRVLKF